MKLLSPISLLSKHQKQALIEPEFARVFGVNLQTTDLFDTDSLGSFDGKVNRTLSPLQCALKKAYLACELTACEQGLGSEGSFNTHFTNRVINQELIAFVDIKNKIEVIASAQSMLDFSLIELSNGEEFAQKMSQYQAGAYKDQKWIVEEHDKLQKGLSWDDVEQYAKQCQMWPLKITPDFRAMNCPLRQETIKKAAEDLVTRLVSRCPKCQAPDFVEKHPKSGPAFLSCEVCGSETQQTGVKSKVCYQCDYQIEAEQAIKTCNAFYCPLCNP